VQARQAATQPRQRAGFAAFPVANELVLVPLAGRQRAPLNEFGTLIWNLCDGLHTPLDMLRGFAAGTTARPWACWPTSPSLLHFHGLG
jgi:hypothetical protein